MTNPTMIEVITHTPMGDGSAHIARYHSRSVLAFDMHYDTYGTWMDLKMGIDGSATYEPMTADKELLSVADELCEAIRDGDPQRTLNARKLYENIRKPQPPKPGQTWHHAKSKSTVFIIGVGKTQDVDTQHDMKDVVIYRHGGDYWTRLLSEFMDGRFERIS